MGILKLSDNFCRKSDSYKVRVIILIYRLEEIICCGLPNPTYEWDVIVNTHF